MLPPHEHTVAIYLPFFTVFHVFSR